MNTTRRSLLAALAAAPALSFPALASASASTSNWPNRTLRMIIPNPPGGGIDITARAIAEQISQLIGQPMICENKAGAGGLVAVKAAAASTDQHTLVYINSGMLTLQAMGGQLNLLKDLKPIARLSTAPLAVVVRNDSPYQTFEELLKAIKSQPNKLSYASGGVGSPPHLMMGLLNDKLGGFEVLHVPLKGAIESVVALTGGQIDFAVSLLGPMAAQLRAGKLRALAVSSPKSLPTLPNVPTLSDSGVPHFSFNGWGGLALPASASDAHVQRIQDVIPKALEATKVRDVLAQQITFADFSNAKDFTSQIERDLGIEKQLVKQLNIKIE